MASDKDLARQSNVASLVVPKPNVPPVDIVGRPDGPIDVVGVEASGLRCCCCRWVVTGTIGCANGEAATVAPAEVLVDVPGRNLVAQHCDTVARHHESVILPLAPASALTPGHLYNHSRAQSTHHLLLIGKSGFTDVVPR